MFRTARRLIGSNWGYLLRKLLRKATCICAPGARVLPTARIINIFGEDCRISLGPNAVVAGELLVFAQGGQIEIGEWSFIGPGSRIWSGASIKVGDRVLISHNVNIFDNLTHPLDASARHAHFKRMMTEGHPRDVALGDRPVIIGDDAWIGAGACVLRGVTIGQRSIVGAGAVVTRDVPDDVTVVGNPARIVASDKLKSLRG